MTEEQVVNVGGGEEISENGDDQRKIKAEYCNGVPHAKEEENGNVGGKVVVGGSDASSDFVGGGEAVTDSGASDLVVLADENAASEEHKVDGEAIGESHATVSEGECEWEVVNNKEKDCADASAESNGSAAAEEDHETATADVVSRESESECAEGQNGTGSVAVSGDKNKKDVTDTVGEGGNEFESVIGAADVQNGVADSDTVVEEGVADHGHEFESVVAGASDVQNGALDRELSECKVENGIGGVVNVDGVQESENTAGTEVSGDEKDVVVEEVADLNKSDQGLESVVVQNSEENEVPVVVEGVTVTAKDVESVDSGGGEEKEGGSDVKGGSETVSYKDIVSKSLAGAVDVQNGLADTELSQCVVKNEIAVNDDVDGVSATRDVKECAGEDAQNSLEKAQIESVSDIVVDKSIAVADVQNGLAEPELSECPEENEIPTEGEPGSKLERSEEDSGHELVAEGENLSDLDSTDMIGDGNVVSDMNDNAVESKGEASVDVCEIQNNAVESEDEPSNNVVQSKVDISNMKTNAEENEAEPSNKAVESEAEPSNKAVESEAIEGELSVGGESSSHGDTQEGSTTENLDGQNTGTEVVKSSFFYLIRVPRYDDDENFKEQINNAFRQVDEKTKIRDAIRDEIQTIKASCMKCSEDVRAAKSEEKAARDLLRSKRQEMDSVQSTVSRLNNVISVGDIDGQIRNMEHRIQHETLALKEEKQLIRQIKQLKQNREELSSSMGKQDQSQQSLDNKDSIGEHSKHLQLLRKEVELLKNNVQKSEAATKAARKKSDDESNKMREVLARYRAADDIRQEAYAELQALKKQLHEKSKYFWEYKNAAKKAQELAAKGKREELQSFCVDEDERIRELWNKNDEFRRDYARCNTRSTLRRLQTLDGRSLGPDEEPPVIPNAFAERAPRNNSLAVLQSTLEQEKKSISTESVNIKNEPVSKDVIQITERSQTTKVKKPAKPAPLEKSVVARWGDESDEDTREEPVRTKEEEELILNAEKARKEEEAAKLKEMRRLEEIEKAKEAMQRKKRNAEKAQQRAALKAQKEAEEREKKREKRAKKKEKRKSASADTADNTEQECAPSLETQTTITEESDQSEKPVEVTKRPQKPSHFTRLTKIKSSLPMPLRNRGRRRIQPWMWVLIAVLVAVALFFVGNSNSLRSSLRRFGF